MSGLLSQGADIKQLAANAGQKRLTMSHGKLYNLNANWLLTNIVAVASPRKTTIDAMRFRGPEEVMIEILSLPS